MKVSKRRAFFALVAVPATFVFLHVMPVMVVDAVVAVPVSEVTPYARVAEALPIPMPVIRGWRTYDLLATAYNAVPEQTDSTPHITATGTRTRAGVAAVSRDLLNVFPYGSRVRVTEVRGEPTKCLGTLEMLIELSPNKDAVFIVEDTMHRRKQNQIDFVMPTEAQADLWGRCEVTLVKA